jgi:MSHA biogenesis protein MshJ
MKLDWERVKPYWDRTRAAIDDMSLRERLMVFVAAAFVVITLMNAMLLDPLLAKQKTMSVQLVQQQEKMKELQAQMQSLLQAKRDDQHSPLRERLAQLKQQLQEQGGYLQSRRDRLIDPNKMADLLKMVLGKNGGLQLVELKTLPVSLLIEKPKAADVSVQPIAANMAEVNKQQDQQKQIFKHGVQITVRGGYLDLMRYVAMLEQMPTQMFWGEATLSVEKYPESLFTLTVYTLSLDKTWLAV